MTTKMICWKCGKMTEGRFIELYTCRKWFCYQCRKKEDNE